MKERLMMFLTHLKVSQKKFEEICTLSNGFVDKVGDSIREANLAKILEHYPELNINWLKTGEGEMLKNVNIDIGGDANKSVVVGNISGNVDYSTDKKCETHHHSGLRMQDIVNMMEERFQHLLKKDGDMLKKDDYLQAIFDENRKMTDELIKIHKQVVAEGSKLVEDNRKFVERINYLTDKLLESEKKL